MSLRSKTLSYQNVIVSFPDERILQVTLNRPQKLNSIDKATSREIQTIWELFDQDETLWVGIITGNGRAFCTGADLQGTFHFLPDIKTIPPAQADRGPHEQNGTG